MAENDIELNIGIKLDEAQFDKEYNSLLSKVSTDTQNQLTTIIKDEMAKGPAATNWGELPFFSMHKSGEDAGHRRTSKAFVASLARDLTASGYAQDSLGYESALVNAAYRSSLPDPMQRYHMLLSQGYLREADITHPDTPLGKTIETDYQLLSQPWSRDFIRQGAEGAYVDFAGMRKYAVETAGLGKWIDEDGGNTADNFEFISDELDNIEEKSKKSEKIFLDWSDTLKGVLGTLTAIGAIEVAAFKASEKAEKMTVAAGGAVDKRRAFIGMSALDELKTKVASRSVGLGEDAISNEIYSMSENIQAFKLFGQGDMLPQSLLGIFDNLLNPGDQNPYDVYTKAADELYKELQGKSPEEKQRWLMLMNKAGLGSMSSLVGQFLSNPDYAKTYGTPSNVFNLKNNPYYGVYNQAELLTPQVAKLNESLRASYNQMAIDWEDTFGIRFKTWWDDVMKTKVVPWFEQILGYLGGDKKGHTLEDDIFSGSLKLLRKQVEITDSVYNTNSADAWVNASAGIIAELGTSPISLPKGFKDKKGSSLLSYDPKEFWNGISRAATYSSYNKKNIGDDEETLRYRATIFKSWAEAHGYGEDFKNSWVATEEGKKKLQAIQSVGRIYMATGDYDATLHAFDEGSSVNTKSFEQIAEFLAKFAEEIVDDPQKSIEVKLMLKDMYGNDIPIEMAEKVISKAAGTTFKFSAGNSSSAKDRS